MGGIIAVSYEARAKGVTRQMSGAEARKACPEIILVQVPTAFGKADLRIYKARPALAPMGTVMVILELNKWISACKPRRRWREALLLLADCRGRQLRGTAVSFSAVVGCCAASTRWREAVMVLAELEGSGLTSVVARSNALTGLEKSGWPKAALLLAGFPDRGLQTDLIASSTFVSACEKAAQWSVALQMLFQEGIEGDVVMRSAAVSACEKASKWHSAVDIFSQGFANIVSYSALMRALARSGRWEAALTLLTQADRGLQVNIVAMGSCLSGCAGAGWAAGLELLRGVYGRGLQPSAMLFSVSGPWPRSLALTALRSRLANAQTLAAATTGCTWPVSLALLHGAPAVRCGVDEVCINAAMACQDFNWQTVMVLLRQMQRTRMEQSAVTLNSAISACEKAMSWQSALHLLWAADVRDLQLDVVSFNSTISACEKAAEWQQAFLLLAALSARRLQRDAFSFNAAISACERRGQWQRALGLLEEAADMADVITFSAAICSCEKASRWSLCIHLLCQAKKNDLQPNILTYNSAICANVRALKWEQVLLLWEMLDEGRADAITYELLISALSQAQLYLPVPALLGSTEPKVLNRWK
ncbi:unnamed protein product [Effrenium voratum]|uniref:UmuC domain-containing protein n=1 Tax=Effrenium voratum TaxID=2562239 RepID=A0AA36IRN9_9DINO|nr:unnamed protein product [Effrenium voratum]